jgi:hypothetical protein
LDLTILGFEGGMVATISRNDLKAGDALQRGAPQCEFVPMDKEFSGGMN